MPRDASLARQVALTAPWFRVPAWCAQTLVGDHKATKAEAMVDLLGRWHLGATPSIYELRAAWGWSADRVISLRRAAFAWAVESGAAHPESIDFGRTPDEHRTNTGRAVAASTPAINATPDDDRTNTGRTPDASRARSSSERDQDQDGGAKTEDERVAAKSNLSTHAGPTVPPASRTTAPDGRPVPPTWAHLLAPLAPSLAPAEAAALAELLRATPKALSPDVLLALPEGRWRYQAGIGGEARAARLANFARRAGWEPGCLGSTIPPQAPTHPREADPAIGDHVAIFATRASPPRFIAPPKKPKSEAEPPATPTVAKEG